MEEDKGKDVRQAWAEREKQLQLLEEQKRKEEEERKRRREERIKRPLYPTCSCYQWC